MAVTAPPETPVERAQRLAGTFHVSYGIDVWAIGEDSQFIVAFGHHDPRRMIAAANHMARKVEGLLNLFDGEGDPEDDPVRVRHVLGWFDPDGPTGDMTWSWTRSLPAARRAGQASRKAFSVPMTVLDRCA